MGGRASDLSPKKQRSGAGLGGIDGMEAAVASGRSCGRQFAIDKHEMRTAVLDWALCNCEGNPCRLECNRALLRLGRRCADENTVLACFGGQPAFSGV